MIKFAFCIFILSSFIYGQQDTIIYNFETKNYDVYYTGEISDANEEMKDTTLYLEMVAINKFIPHVSFWLFNEFPEITKINNGRYLYLYGIENDESSEQGIRALTLYVNNSENEISDVSKHLWDKWHRVDRFKWSALGVINPSFAEYGFFLETFYLPIIGTAYCQGRKKVFTYYVDDIVPKYQYMDDKINDLFSGYELNGKLVKTVVPEKAPTPFVYTSFLDSLLSYTNKAYELGWITDESARDKYISFFDNTKSFLEQNQKPAANSILTAILRDVEQDSAVTLSNESYALIKFNSEYLQEQIAIE